jgi:hypothetical protein
MWTGASLHSFLGIVSSLTYILWTRNIFHLNISSGRRDIDTRGQTSATGFGKLRSIAFGGRIASLLTLDEISGGSQGTNKVSDVTIAVASVLDRCWARWRAEHGHCDDSLECLCGKFFLEAANRCDSDASSLRMTTKDIFLRWTGRGLFLDFADH